MTRLEKSLTTLCKNFICKCFYVNQHKRSVDSRPRRYAAKMFLKSYLGISCSHPHVPFPILHALKHVDIMHERQAL